MTNATVINNIVPKVKDTSIKKGDYFLHERRQEIYMVMSFCPGNGAGSKYCVVCVTDGCFWTIPSDNIEDVFGGDDADFLPIENVTITIS